MKKKIYLLCLFLFFTVLLGMNVYSQDSATKNNTTFRISTTVIHGLDYTDSDELKTYVNLYKKKRQHRVHKKVGVFGGHKDAYNIWFDYERFTEFMLKAKTYIESTGHKLSGIRFYYAVYPKKDDMVNKDYKLSHTLVIVPTKTCSDGTCKKNHDVIEVVEEKKWILAYYIRSPRSMNNGTLCPPLTNCDGCEY